MKKLRKNQLRLDKEVISSLTENDLSDVKGGVNPPVSNKCAYTELDNACITVIHGDCQTNAYSCQNCNTKDYKCILVPVSDACQTNPAKSAVIKETCPCVTV